MVAPTKTRLASSTAATARQRSCYLRSTNKKPHAYAQGLKNGGPDKDRTCDLLHAMQALSQLSYGPVYVYSIAIFFRFEKKNFANF